MEATAAVKEPEKQVEVKKAYSLYSPQFTTEDTKRYNGFQPMFIINTEGSILSMVTRHVHFNCQSFAIAAINQLIYRDDFMDIIFDTYYEIGKNILLVDVQAQVARSLRTKFPGVIIVDQPYTSTNNSSMVLMSFNLQTFFRTRVAELNKKKQTF